MRHRVAIALSSLALLFATSVPGLAQGGPSCQFVLGFATIHDLIPDKVGICTDNESHNPNNGDALQHSTGGLLVWRKLDNWTAFTDGYWTWVNGPYGLDRRLNTQRFSWEANPQGLPLADAPTPAAPSLVSRAIRPLRPVSLNDPNGVHDVAAQLFPASVEDQCDFDGQRLDHRFCPVTDQLAARLNALGNGFDPVCRCQNFDPDRAITATPTQDGGVAHVVQHWTGSISAFDVTVVRLNDGWYASDITCTGMGPESSIFRDSLLSCTHPA